MIKVRDIAYVRFAAPDLDRMERFLCDFGLAVAHRDPSTLYARGTDPEPYLHVTELGDAGFRGMAFEAFRSNDELTVTRNMIGGSQTVIGSTKAPVVNSQ